MFQSRWPLHKRPWGYFEILAEGPGYKVKRLTVEPGQATSLQYHHCRNEYWVFPETGAIQYIPAMSPHRLENTGDKPLTVIEVQTGDVLREDDIVRLHDRYGRQE